MEEYDFATELEMGITLEATPEKDDTYQHFEDRYGSNGLSNVIVHLDRAVWESMGFPERITIAVEPLGV